MRWQMAGNIRQQVVMAMVGQLVAVVACPASAVAGRPASADEAGVGHGDAVALVARYCHGCHAGDAVEGDVDLAGVGSLDAMRPLIHHWQRAAEVVADGQMPPLDAEQPSEGERETIHAWLTAFLRREAEAHAGDPGRVVLRRLNNAEYTYTLRELTGIESLDPAREFPADGGAGEGFTNTGQSLVMSPAMVVKYLDAAKDVARHLVLLPDGIRFSAGRSRRDFTDELLEQIRSFYRRYTESLSDEAVSAQTTVEQGITLDMGREGFLPLRPALEALRQLEMRGTSSPEAIREAADRQGVSAKYLAILVELLGRDPAQASPASANGSLLLESLRDAWRAGEDVDAIAGRIERWQRALWRFNKVGQIGRHLGREDGPASWMERVLPLIPRHEVRLPMPPADEHGMLTLHLAATTAGDAGVDDLLVFERPRLVAAGRADLPLADVEDLAAAVGQWRAEVATQAGGCLAAAAEALAAAAAGAPLELEQLATTHGVDPRLLAGWLTVLGIAAEGEVTLGEPIVGRGEGIDGWPFVNGWTGADALSVLANASDQEVQIPGTMRPHSVGVHPAPNRQVIVAWQSPLAASVGVSGSVQRAHIGCGNGVRWSVQVRRRGTQQVLAEGVADGADAALFSSVGAVPVQPGDAVCLVVGPRDGNHACDMTAIALTVSTADRAWDLAADVSPDILAGNPHADATGTQMVWHFTSEPTGAASAPVIPAGSLAARWLAAASDQERARLAEDLAGLLKDGPTSLPDEAPDRQLWQLLTAASGPILSRSMGDWLAARAASGGTSEADILLAAPACRTFRFPAELAAGCELVTAAAIAPDAGGEASVQPSVGAGDFDPRQPLRADLPIVAREGSPAWLRFSRSFDDFRSAFPQALCYVRIVPVDEVVTLNVLYREDDQLRRLMLSDAEAAELERLWDELLFVSAEPLQLEASLEQITEFATQDRPDLAIPFRQMKPAVEARAAAYRERLLEARAPQLAALIGFAERAFRRPLEAREAADLHSLHAMLLDEGLAHPEAMAMLLARVLVSPDFLYKLEEPPAGESPQPVSPHELATRLSYFLWSSPPDAELLETAAAGTLADPEVLVAEARRLRLDDRVRRLAIEFGTHWLHVSGFAEACQKNEALFPEFAGLREAIEEETVLFLTDFFREDRPILSLLDADHTFVNGPLAAHYEIQGSGIAGGADDHWRRVDGVRAVGRGGVLTLASTLATQAGASRTSPILRGNWLFETILGEKLPKPPKDVPQLAEEVPQGLSERQLIELHSANASCARCHRQIDPLGFALEEYDAVGRFRREDAAGQPIDAATSLPDGTVLEGIEGLRQWLLTSRREAFVRQFCRKLLGYALGRGVQLSDEPLLDAMVARLAEDDRVGVAIEMIVTSPQFRMIRGREYRDALAADEP